MIVIYELNFKNSKYVGSTSNIRKRIQHHKSLLNRQRHPNKNLQRIYNIEGSFKVNILEECSKEARWDRENYYIRKFKEQGDNILNISEGVGLKGLKHDEDTKDKIRNKLSGSGNPQNKLSYEEFTEMVEMFLDLKGNKIIGETFNLHPRYISLIRAKRRLRSYWERLGMLDVDIPESSDNVGLTFEEFTSVLEMIELGKSNKDIAEYFTIDPSVVSRIKSKKTYRKYFKILENSTTIERH